MQFDLLLAPWQAVLTQRLADQWQASPGEPTLAPAAGQQLLDTMSELHMQTGGKRLRGLLPAALVAAGDGPVDAALSLGAAIEWVHNGTLVHDDVQDRDELRRGTPTLWARFGVAQAINAGDALLVTPLAALLRDPAVPNEHRVALTLLVADALLATIAGQTADLLLHGHGLPSLEHVGAVHVGKTAPLFEACLAGAAILLELPPATQATIQPMAKALGLAFQIRDDLLDALGLKGRGQAGADVREGKPTWPMLLAADSWTGEQRDRLGERLHQAAQGEPLDDAEVGQIINDIKAHGGIDAASGDLHTQLQAVREVAQDVWPPQCALVLVALCDRLAKLDG